MSKTMPRGDYRKNWDMPHTPKVHKRPKYKEDLMDEVEEDDDTDFFDWPKDDEEEGGKEKENGKREERQALSV